MQMQEESGADATVALGFREAGYRVYDHIMGGRVFRHLSEVRQLYGQPDVMGVFAERRLESLLSDVRRHVEFYEVRGKVTGLTDLPVVNRATIQENLPSFLSRAIHKKDRIETYTSGTSARPFMIISDREKVARKRAEVLHLNQMCGYRLGMRFVYLRATARGKNDVMPEVHKLTQNEINADIVDVSPQELQRIRQRLQRGDIEFMVAWPSVLRMLVDGSDNPASFPKAFRGIVTTGEALFEPDRALIKNAFGCEVFNRYGCTEVGIIAYEDSTPGRLLVNRASVLVEVLKIDDDKPAPIGEPGRIVVTDLYSNAMPLIRYDTGDVGVARALSGDRVTELSSVDGRYMERFLDAEGRYVLPMMLIHCLPDSERVKLKQFQFVQEGEGCYVFRATVGDKGIDEAKIVAGMRDVLGQSSRIRFEYRDAIGTEKSKKYAIMRNEWRRESAAGV